MNRTVIVEPTRFADGENMVHSVLAGHRVVLDLRSVERALARRLIELATVAAYCVGGKMRRIGDQMFLLTPPPVRKALPSAE